MDASRIDHRSPGFTVIELLVVMAVIGLLVALLIPAVQNAREAARRTQCRNHLKQLGLALHNYHDLHTTFPPGVVADNDNLRDALHSGFALLLPFLEQTHVYHKYNFEVEWRDPTNAEAAATRISILICPTSGGNVPQPGAYDFGPTEYAFSKGPKAFLCLRGVGEGMFDVNSHIAARLVKDGLSTTFAMGEAAGNASLAAQGT